MIGCAWPSRHRLPILEQDIVATTPHDLGLAFAEFWGGLWNRDCLSSDMSLRSCPAYEAMLPRLSAMPHVAPLPAITVEQWQHAIRKMSSRKASGVCGWHASEVKLLPTNAVALLCEIFRRAEPIGLPGHMLQARVCVLSKAALPTTMRQSRPITIFSVLYRFGLPLPHVVSWTTGGTCARTPLLAPCLPKTVSA